MAAARHNLTRRALLGASGALPVAFAAGARAECGAPNPDSDPTPFALSPSKGLPSPLGSEGRGGLRQAQPERNSFQGDETEVTLRRRWARTLAAYRRAMARVAGFKAEEALLPAARRAWPACEDLEQRFGALDSRRFAALRRLLRLPAPDLSALALKPVLSDVEGLDLAVADQAWELTGCEGCLAALAADARRLAGVVADGGRQYCGTELHRASIQRRPPLSRDELALR